MSLLHAANKEEFDQLLSDAGDKLVAIDFFATWCGPCRMIGPKFQAMAESGEYPSGKYILTF